MKKRENWWLLQQEDGLKHVELEKMKKKENGWLLQEEEDGESQNTFNWTGWMTRWMDGKNFMTTLHNHDVFYYM
jgi:hypothetical protein